MSVNKVILVGHLGADPEARYMPSGDAISNLRLATTDKYKDKATGEWKETTEWHRVAFFGRLAEVCNEYLKKGAQIYVEGSIKTQQYEKDGQTRYQTSIRGVSMQMLGGGSGRAGDAGDDGGGRQRSSAPAQRQPRPAANRPPAGTQDRPLDELDDDIPF